MAMPPYFHSSINVVTEPESAHHRLARKYHIQSMNVDQDIRERYYGYNSYYYAGDNPTVTVRMSLRAFEDLAGNDMRSEDILEAQFQESRLRNRYPALQKAYEEYQVLLELMRET